MADARGDIIAAIRAARGRGPVDEPTARRLRARLHAPQRNLIPERAMMEDRGARVDLFERLAKIVAASVARVAAPGQVPGAVATYLAEQALDPAIVMAPDVHLDAYPWADQPTFRIRRGVPGPSDGIGIAQAFAGIAETGTLMLISGSANPTTLNFLPETQIVILPADRVVGPYEDAWDLLRAERGPVPPRTVNLVTGPSRTADIELTIQVGVHGPRRLLIVLVGTP